MMRHTIISAAVGLSLVPAALGLIGLHTWACVSLDLDKAAWAIGVVSGALIILAVVALAVVSDA